MDEAVMYGVAVALLMLGVPLWHSMGECRKGRLVRVHLCRWWLVCGFMVMFSLVVAVIFGLAGFVIQNSPPPKAARVSADCKVLSKGNCHTRFLLHIWIQTDERGWSWKCQPAIFCSLNTLNLSSVSENPNSVEPALEGADSPRKIQSSFILRKSGVLLSLTLAKLIGVDVDIRSAKVCEVGQTGHKSKGWKNPDGPYKFLCSLDYYWTAVLKVEYTPHGSESIIHAEAEFPSEALPSTCRPDFGVVWNIKENLMINKTYTCKYGAKNAKTVEISVQSAHIAANCTVGDLSSTDLLRQFWYLLIHSENSILSSSGKAGELFSRAAAAVGLGICYSMIVTGFTRTLCHVHFRLDQGEYTDLEVVYFEARIQLAILFTASLFGVLWFSNRYAIENVDVDMFLETFYKRTGHIDRQYEDT